MHALATDAYRFDREDLDAGHLCGGSGARDPGLE
jgi:hypothetical protein